MKPTVIHGQEPEKANLAHSLRERGVVRSPLSDTVTVVNHECLGGHA